MVIKQELEDYFVDLSSSCPYGFGRMAVFHQAMFVEVDDESMGDFLAAGYRRNGNCLYSMRCPDCSACVPIRLPVASFVPNRNQKRINKKNRDVKIEINRLGIDDEKLTLLAKFLATRFPDGKGQAEDYYMGFFITSMSNCFEIHYRVGGKLLGVSIVDAGSKWLNAVYFFFDPDEEKRSPGVFNILSLLKFCHNHKITFLYLGYWIESLSSMNYKVNFKPYELLLGESWQLMGK